MSRAAETGLKSVAGKAVILEAVNIAAHLKDLFAEVAVTQHYRNPERDPIEAIYTFPLPSQGVLLEFAAEIGDRKLAGRVVGRAESEEQYENAIAAGDAAVLLEPAGEGLFSASIGNLLPGETAIIRFRYALLLDWNGDRVRFAIPTTIAPRFGDPAAAGLAPHQEPVYALDAERRFSLSVKVAGLLKDARFNSPSHELAVTSVAVEKRIALVGRPAMNRDFILEMLASRAEKAAARFAHDCDGFVALASFCPKIPTSGPDERRGVTIVVDCSGSMEGDSIAQAKVALERILDEIRENDLFEIIAFGNEQRALFSRLAPVSATALATARGFVRALEANMGGTEIAQALAAAYAVRGPAKVQRDILLITDGQVWDKGEIIARAQHSGQRIFGVGVGNAAVEPFIRRLGKATGGASEFASPREDMAGRIHRHFQRVYAPRADSAVLHWPYRASLMIPDSIETVFDGDTLHVFAWFAEKPEGMAALEVTLADGQHFRQEVPVLPFEEQPSAPAPGEATIGTLARLAAARRLSTIEDQASGSEIAERYQLVSRWTNYLIVHVRDESEKSGELPRIRTIPQALAAPHHFAEASMPRAISLRDEGPLASQSARRPFRAERTEAATPASLVSHLNSEPIPPLPTLDDLAALGVPDDIITGLRVHATGGDEEGDVVLVFLHLLAQSPSGRLLSREVKRFILHSFRSLAPPQSLIDAVAVTANAWLAPTKRLTELLTHLRLRP